MVAPMTEYKVEKEGEPLCETCGHGQMYMIVNSDEVGFSTTFEDLEAAQELCDVMNEAFERGQNSKLPKDEQTS